MGTIDDYRKSLREQVEAARERRKQAPWGAELESLGAPDVLGHARGGDADRAALLTASAGSGSSGDPELRAAVLGGLVARSEPDKAHEVPLERLADGAEHPRVRLAALLLLKQLTFSSHTFEAWRPEYLTALRAALSVPELRLPAFGVLTGMGDRRAQELLVEGLKDPTAALVPVADALNLLSNDPHADVREVAREIADSPPDDRALEAALRHLATDPASEPRLRAILGDAQKPIAARKTAATALFAQGHEDLLSPAPPALNALVDVEANRDPVVEHVHSLQRRRAGL